MNFYNTRNDQGIIKFKRKLKTSRSSCGYSITIVENREIRAWQRSLKIGNNSPTRDILQRNRDNVDAGNELHYIRP